VAGWAALVAADGDAVPEMPYASHAPGVALLDLLGGLQPTAVRADRGDWMRRSKYGAVPTVVDNIRFASKAEARRYAELLLLQKAGEIEALELQPKFPLLVNGVKVATYIGDFRYFALDRHSPPFEIIEDVKGGPTTPVYRLKKKLVLALHGVEITEVRA